jgi:hypothetical protein
LVAKGQSMPFDDVVREARAALARHDSSARPS